MEQQQKMRVSRLLNVAQVKKYALAYSKNHRSGLFTRVSAEFIDKVEAELKVLIQARIHRHPSKGKTLID